MDFCSVFTAFFVNFVFFFGIKHLQKLSGLLAIRTKQDHIGEEGLKKPKRSFEIKEKTKQFLTVHQSFPL